MTKKPNKTLTARYMDITPKQAAAWLKADEGIKDRKLRDGWVKQLAQDMSSGNFKLTHQAIAFDEEGGRVDGQHRLNAIVESNTTQRMLVVEGLPREAASVIDINKSRTLADAIAVSLDPASAHTVQVTVSMYMGNKLKRRLTRPEQIEFFAKYREAMQWAVDQVPNSKTAKVGRAGVRAAVARAYVNANGSTQKIGKIKRFCEVLRDGQAAVQAELQISKLRDWLMRNTQYAGSTASVEAYSKTSNVLWNHMEGNVRTGEPRTTSVNYFPLDEDGDETV